MTSSTYLRAPRGRPRKDKRRFRPDVTPIQYIDREDLERFARKSAAGQAWRDLAPTILRRDPRARKWLFIMGWLACARYYRVWMQRTVEALADEMQQRAMGIEEQWAYKSGIDMFEEVKGIGAGEPAGGTKEG